MAPLTLRINDSWVNLSGNLDKPRYVILVDKTASAINNQAEAIGINEQDLIVQFAKGTFQNVNDFLKLKSRDLVDAEAFVILWMGMEELCIDASSLPPSDNPAFEAYFHPLGPKIFPHREVDDVVAAYEETVLLILSLFPRSVVITSDPAPRRSSGFAIMRAKNVTKGMKKQDARHRHLSLIHKFHGRRASANSHEPGGKFPVINECFEDGVIPKVETWASVFERCYAAVDAMLDDKSVGPSQLNILKLVKIMF